MNNLKRREELKEEEYQGIFGVTKATFDKMLLILEEAYKQRHSKGGSPLKNLSVLDKLIITLGYYREYRHSVFTTLPITLIRMTTEKSPYINIIKKREYAYIILKHLILSCVSRGARRSSTAARL